MFPIRDHNPSGRTPYVTYALMAVNILVYLYALYTGVYEDSRTQLQFYAEYAAVPVWIGEGYNLKALLTSQFLHAGFVHLLGNMLFLWIYGDNIEDMLGPVGFLAFYLVAGVLAVYAHIWSNPFSNIPLVGASGAISGVIGAYLLFFPKARVDVIFFFLFFIKKLAVPAYLVIGGWLVFQLVGSFGLSGGNTAYFAHLGGFAAGLAMGLPLWLYKGGTRFWARFGMVPPHPATRVQNMGNALGLPRVKRRR